MLKKTPKNSWTSLEEFIQSKDDERQKAKDRELLARAEQIRILQHGPEMRVSHLNCPHCGKALIDLPTKGDDDYDTRL